MDSLFNANDFDQQQLVPNRQDPAVVNKRLYVCTTHLGPLDQESAAVL